MARLDLILVCVLFGVAFTVAAPCDTSCQYTNKLWGDPNPNVYHFCNPATNTSVELPCPSGRGFIDNGTYTGCVPFSEWPQSCVTQLSSPPTCDWNHSQQPSGATNLNQYYLCPSIGASPVLLTCASGKGFISNIDYLGCLDWAEWRTSKPCITY